MDQLFDDQHCGLQTSETVLRKMTSGFWHQLLISVSFFVSHHACPSLLSSQPRNCLRKGGEGSFGGVGWGGGPRWVTATLSVGRYRTCSYKTQRWMRSSSDFARSGAPCRDARYGAHFPRAVLLSGVVSVCPQGRLQVYWGKFQHIL